MEKKDVEKSEWKAPEAARNVLTIDAMSPHVSIKLRLSVTTSDVDVSEAWEVTLSCKVTRVKEVPFGVRVKLFDQERLLWSRG